MLEVISDRDLWEQFYEYRTSLIRETAFNRELRVFIDNERYLPYVEKFKNCELSIPQKKLISKKDTSKKRVIYMYEGDERTIFKFLTWYILRKYDNIFCDNLYSFRPHTMVKTAIRRLKKCEVYKKYYYKTDLSNYFNSIPIDKMLNELKEVLKDEDNDFYELMEYMLTEHYIMYHGEIETEDNKGIMAGVPLACFLANIYLRKLDEYFQQRGIIYARYSDDIIVFADTAEQRDNYMNFIKGYIYDKGLCLNPKKDVLGSPQDKCLFLGFCIENDGTIDISSITIDKLKAKMRRKTRALMRWGNRKKVPYEKRAERFITVFNHKLFDRPEETELSWSYWYFPVITTAKSLKIIDAYAQDCIRYLGTGKRTKSRYNVKYQDMKDWGYCCLVNEYYKGGKHNEIQSNSYDSR